MKAGANTAPGAGPCHATAGETGARFSSDLFAPVCVFCVFCVSPFLLRPPPPRAPTHDRSRHGGTASRHRRHAFHSPGEPPRHEDTRPEGVAAAVFARHTGPEPGFVMTAAGGPLARRHGPEELKRKKRKKRKQAQMKAGRNTTPGVGPSHATAGETGVRFPSDLFTPVCVFCVFCVSSFLLRSPPPRAEVRFVSTGPGKGGRRTARREVRAARPACPRPFTKS